MKIVDLAGLVEVSINPRAKMPYEYRPETKRLFGLIKTEEGFYYPGEESRMARVTMRAARERHYLDLNEDAKELYQRAYVYLRFENSHADEMKIFDTDEAAKEWGLMVANKANINQLVIE